MLSISYNGATMITYETFDIKPRMTLNGLSRRPGKYASLLDLPVSAHQHFADTDPKTLRAAAAKINKDSFEAGSPLHLSVITVGADDPKGAGVRVLRDDKPMMSRPRKTQDATSAQWHE